MDNINELAAALAKAQGVMRAAELDRVNPFFKSRYATLASIWTSIREPLTANGLSITQLIEEYDGRLVLQTLLLHASGQSLQSTYPIRPVKDDPQGIGSAISYARRYSIAAMGGAVSDEDDDGAEASKPAKPQVQQATPKPAQAPVLEAKAPIANPHDAAFEQMPASPASAEAQASKANDKPTSEHVNMGSASVSGNCGRTFLDMSAQFAKEHPHYLLGNGNPDRAHILTSAAALGYKFVTLDNIQQVFAELADHDSQRGK
jgi:hypothetical protein